jgi:hypothetical protein
MKTIDTKFSDAFAIFYAGCVKIYNDHCDQSGFSCRDTFSYRDGNRYVRVFRGGSAHAFIGKQNGDVLKPANWKAPAKHARGNIYDATNGLALMNEYGPAYLR